MQAFLQKRGGPRYYFNNSSNDMECGKDLPEGEKLLVIKEIAKAKTHVGHASYQNRKAFV